LRPARRTLRASDAIVQRILRGQDDDGERGLPRPDVAQHLEPGAARQHQVEDDGIVIDRARLLPGHQAVSQHVDGIALLGQAALDEVGDLLIVFDDKDAHGLNCSPSSALRATARQALSGGGWLPALAGRLPPAPSIRGSRATENVAQQVLVRYRDTMPVAVAQKVKMLRVDFRSAAQLADLLGVSRSQVTRWLRGAGIDPLNAEKVDLLELVWSNVLRIYDRDAALAWLFGVNPLLGDRRPVDLIRLGRTEELMRAIRAERSDTFA
jgi:uncharacterized protein (DUF2384 family)